MTDLGLFTFINIYSAVTSIFGPPGPSHPSQSLPALPVPPGPPTTTPPPTKKSSLGTLRSKAAHQDYITIASYSPASHRSTIGASGLNFSVRNGKRWNPAAITTLIFGFDGLGTNYAKQETHPQKFNTGKDFGQLVALGFDVTVFTPAPYQRPRLGRPSLSSHLAEGFALRCFQRLSTPDTGTLRCAWRHNRFAGGPSATVLSY